MITHIVGARPNFPKAAPVISALNRRGQRQRLVHTGQHYDDRLSSSFFQDLDLPAANVNLGVGSGRHAIQTGALLVALDAEFESHVPDLVVVYGDINSTVAAAMCAAKLQIPSAHIEAGLRSFDRTMPEEINRVVTDQLSDLLFTTSPEATDNLLAEGVDKERIHFVGNPMIDTLLAHIDSLDPRSVQLALGLPHRYAVATIHRPSNVDDPVEARALVEALLEASTIVDIVMPLHPRGREVLLDNGLGSSSSIHVTEPLGYRNFIALVRGSRAVITDSGGVQEETTVMGIPCLTIRPNTERPVTITHGTNQLLRCEVLAATLAEVMMAQGQGYEFLPRPSVVPPLWDGKAGQRIAKIISEWMN